MIGWAFEALIASALLMALVLLLRERVAAAFGPRVAYMLWLLPLARMLLPRLPEGTRPPVALPIGIDLPMIDMAAGPLAAAPLPLDGQPPAPGAFDWLASHWPMLVLAVWLGGAALHFGWQIGMYRHFVRAALRGSALLCRTCGIAIHRGPHVGGPAAVGIVHRRILLPADFTTRYDPAERRLVLAHEVAHHVRGDLIANGAALAILSLHWFNPLAHRAYRAFRADQELACDATVLAHEAPELMPVYGAALIKSAHAATPAAACAIGTATMLKRRLKMMARPNRSRVRHIGGGVLAIATILGGLALTASGSVAAPSRLPGFQAAMTRIDDAVPAIARAADPSLPAAPVQVAPAVEPIRFAQARAEAVSVSAPDAEIMSPAPPVPPALAVPPAPPLPALALVPPAPPALPDFEEIRREARAAADEGRAAAAEARAEARREAAEVRAEARLAAAEARGEAVRARAQSRADAGVAMSTAHVGETVAAAMAQARAQIAANCRFAKPAIGPETDRQAIARLSAGCVDHDAIRIQVSSAMRQARDSVRMAPMDERARERAMDAMDRAIERMENRRPD